MAGGFLELNVGIYATAQKDEQECSNQLRRKFVHAAYYSERLRDEKKRLVTFELRVVRAQFHGATGRFQFGLVGLGLLWR